MSEQQGMYGYKKPEEGSGGGGKFGLNAGAVRITKFEYITNAGKGGAQGEALDIVFDINGSPKNYRLFPITQGFEKVLGTDGKPTGESKVVTDPSHPAVIAEFENLNAKVTAILSCFMSEEDIATAYQTAVPDFKTFCDIAVSLLPQGYQNTKLDIFLQYQWQPGEGKTQTYLEIPKKTSYGKFICAEVPHIGGWKEERTATSLRYVDEQGNEHPFKRGEWFMNSNFAKQIKPAERTNVNMAGGQQPATGGASGPVQPANSGW